jgi:hypothetical protein
VTVNPGSRSLPALKNFVVIVLSILRSSVDLPRIIAVFRRGRNRPFGVFFALQTRNGALDFRLPSSRRVILPK